MCFYLFAPLCFGLALIIPPPPRRRPHTFILHSAGKKMRLLAERIHFCTGCFTLENVSAFKNEAFSRRETCQTRY